MGKTKEFWQHAIDTTKDIIKNPVKHIDNLASDGMSSQEAVVTETENTTSLDHLEAWLPTASTAETAEATAPTPQETATAPEEATPTTQETAPAPQEAIATTQETAAAPEGIIATSQETVAAPEVAIATTQETVAAPQEVIATTQETIPTPEVAHEETVTVSEVQAEESTAPENATPSSPTMEDANQPLSWSSSDSLADEQNLRPEAPQEALEGTTLDQASSPVAPDQPIDEKSDFSSPEGTAQPIQQ